MRATYSNTDDRTDKAPSFAISFLVFELKRVSKEVSISKHEQERVKRIENILLIFYGKFNENIKFIVVFATKHK